MVTAATQKRQRKASTKAAAKAAARVKEVAAVTAAAAKPKAKAAKAPKGEYAITAEQIIEERDKKGLSWKQVGINLDIGSPSAARKAYTVLTGKPHYESLMTGKRAPRGSNGTGRKTFHPNWNDESDQDEIIERLQGSRRITVRRSYKGIEMGEEELEVERVVKFTFDGKEQDGPLVVHFGEKASGATRSIRVADIVDVR